MAVLQQGRMAIEHAATGDDFEHPDEILSVVGLLLDEFHLLVGRVLLKEIAVVVLRLIVEIIIDD